MKDAQFTEANKQEEVEEQAEVYGEEEDAEE